MGALLTASENPAMTMFLRGAVIALSLAGAALTAQSATASGMGGYNNIEMGPGERQGHGLAINASWLVSGSIAFGYADGFWDNGHAWHRWADDEESRNYRARRGSNYHAWNHDRNGDFGWLRH